MKALVLLCVHIKECRPYSCLGTHTISSSILCSYYLYLMRLVNGSYMCTIFYSTLVQDSSALPPPRSLLRAPSSALPLPRCPLRAAFTARDFSAPPSARLFLPVVMQLVNGSYMYTVFHSILIGMLLRVQSRDGVI